MSVQGGLRVLLVEDESMIAMLIEDMLEELGCEIAGTAGRLDEALDAAGRLSFDLAILDVNLDGTTSYPVAALLRARGIPFAFSTGYGPQGLDPAYAGVPTLQKPFVRADLEATLRHLAAP